MTYQDPFVAIADPTRRAILTQLRLGPSTVGRIAERMPVSRPAVSQHLKVLRDAQLVTARRKGTSSIYALDRGGFVEMLRWIDHMWSDALDAFADHVEAENAKEQIKDQEQLKKGDDK